MSVAFFMDWFAYDVDGAIASVGIDSDLDGIVDVTLPSDSGATDPQSSIQLANGDTMNGGFKLPLEEGVSISRMTDFKEDDESLVVCGLIIQKSFAVIAEDNLGQKPWFQSLHQLHSVIGMMLLMAYKFKRLSIRIINSTSRSRLAIRTRRFMPSCSNIHCSRPSRSIDFEWRRQYCNDYYYRNCRLVTLERQHRLG